MCKHPFWNKEQGIYCPCGHCEYCLSKRIESWTVRMMNELETDPKGACFITLTYSNENLPPFFSVRKADAQKFFKRLRKNCTPLGIKYYLCGEYGEHTHRPHYHTIIFGLTPVDEAVIRKSWTLGLVHIGESVTPETCAYVAKYVTKMIRGKDYSYAPREAPFQLQSQGLGKDYAYRYATRIKDKLHLTQNGYKKPVPRYYRKKLNICQVDYEKSGIIEEKSKKLLDEINSYGVQLDYQKKSPTEIKKSKESGRMLGQYHLSEDQLCQLQKIRTQYNNNLKAKRLLKDRGKL